MRAWLGRTAKQLQQDGGSSILELTFVVPLLMYLLFGAVDFGRAYYLAIELQSAAEAGAIYGINNPSDAAGIRTAAQADAPSIPSVTTSASYGCECSDGSGAVASCSTTPTCLQNYVNYVDVSASTNYSLLLKYPGLPSAITVSSRARMRVGGD